MDHREAGRFWNANAATWTQLARAGYDVYRDHLNTPAFFELLPEVSGLRGLDIGCGEGHNTRLLAERGARVTGIDIAEVFVAHAREMEEREPLGISYEVASAVELPFPDASFDFATGFMSFMDIPETGLPKFRIPRFSRTLSQWLNLLVETGFLLERLAEPRPSDETVRACPEIQDAQVVSYFLHCLVRRPG